MANIGIIHYKLGSTDGVSLEVEKLQGAFEKMGHKVFLAAGDLGHAKGDTIEGVYHHSERAERLTENMFYGLNDYPSEEAFREDLFSFADEIEKDLDAFLDKHNIDLLVPQNIWSVGMNPAAAVAMGRVVQKRKLPTLAHNHDFYWERKPPVMLSCPTAIEVADKYLPVREPWIEHMVINKLTQQQLFERKRVKATVLPNVFDFDAPAWGIDEYNKNFRQEVGIRENDVVLLQATRIIRRKGIEMAIDVIKAMNTPERRQILEQKGLYNGKAFTKDSRLLLVFAGYSEDPKQVYLNQLKDKINNTGIDAHFITDHIKGDREEKNGKKYFSLWDSYVFADMVTYPSTWEGWGNQLLETIRAELPFLLYEYPVFVSDIGPTGIKGVSLGQTVDQHDAQGLAVLSQNTLDRCADEMIELLWNKEKRQAMVKNNFRIAAEHFATSALGRYVGPSLERALKASEAK